MIRLSDVVKEYESGTTALKGISLRIEDGEFVFLVGPSGSGKSTIIKLLTGEIVPTSGQIAVNGFSLTNIAERQIPLLRRSVGVIFQDFRLDREENGLREPGLRHARRRFFAARDQKAHPLCA
mgnify:CR=1 FL=1